MVAKNVMIIKFTYPDSLLKKAAFACETVSVDQDKAKMEEFEEYFRQKVSALKGMS